MNRNCMAAVVRSDELRHHGVMGMEWGERHGPPYPLGGLDKKVARAEAKRKKARERALEKARKLLKDNKSLLDTMARVLVERETIFSEEVDMIMDGKSADEVIAFMDENERTLSQNPFARKAGPDAVKEYKNDENKPAESSETKPEEDGATDDKKDE